MIKTTQDADTINKRDWSLHQEITILENINPTKIPNRIRITTQNSAMITIIPQCSNITQQDNTVQPLQSEQKASKERDRNNNVQANLRTTTPTQREESSTPTIHTTSRGTCNGTIYRLTPMGKSNHPVHQAGPCHTHPQNDSRDPQGNTNNSE